MDGFGEFFLPFLLLKGELGIQLQHFSLILFLMLLFSQLEFLIFPDQLLRFGLQYLLVSFQLVFLFPYLLLHEISFVEHKIIFLFGLLLQPANFRLEQFYLNLAISCRYSTQLQFFLLFDYLSLQHLGAILSDPSIILNPFQSIPKFLLTLPRFTHLLQPNTLLLRHQLLHLLHLLPPSALLLQLLAVLLECECLPTEQQDRPGEVGDLLRLFPCIFSLFRKFLYLCLKLLDFSETLLILLAESIIILLKGIVLMPGYEYIKDLGGLHDASIYNSCSLQLSQRMSSYSYLFKYIIIGDPSVGKSCALMQFLEGKFKLDSETTIGVEFGSKIVQVGTKKVKMQIWDTAGQEVFKSITRSYYRGSIAAILMYDTTNRISFNNLNKWLEETRTYANDKLTIILVGNKNDLENKREISTNEAAAFAEANRMLFMESSAKDHELTTEIFHRLATEIMRKIDSGEIDPKNESYGVKLGGYKEEKTEQNRRMCC